MRIVFVCLGNICRSPTAAALFVAMLSEAGRAGVEVDSAGTGGHFAGHPAAPGAVRAARAVGLDLRSHRARQLAPEDARADLLIAMDRENAADIGRRFPAAPLRLLREYSPGGEGGDLPDPYMGEASFDQTLEIIRAGCRGLLDTLRREGLLGPRCP